MAEALTIPLRFQRAELRAKANLSSRGLAALDATARPEALVQELAAAGEHRDAVFALTLLLPHRQTVWWACLAAYAMPRLAQRPADLAALEAAERWVRSAAPADAEEAGAAAERADPGAPAAWAATAAFWAGPSLAPRGQQPVPPAPHLPGVAARATLVLLTAEPELRGRVDYAGLLAIGVALMNGGNGRDAQAALLGRPTGG